VSAVPGIDTVLIANRGEIAVRVARTLRALGIRSVVAHHRVDRDGPAVRAADAAVEIEASEPIAAYLDSGQIAAAAARVGADAVHPGYGFLAENPAFAEAVAKAGVRFIGPPPGVMRLMGDKIAARRFASEHGFRVAPAAVEEGDARAFVEQARRLGFPLLVKPSAGGGGKGMIRVAGEEELEPALARARAEAARYFGDDRLYVERFVERPRHVEVQVLADRNGRCVHLFERECSVQRRFQKLVEESPAPGIPDDLRAALCREAVGIALAAGYEGAGTVEFVLSPSGEFHFLEMNTRLQVEHPVTELVTGVDLVAEQVRVAAGEPLRFGQADLSSTGCAIECRICAEDPEDGFLPTTGNPLLVRVPKGSGVRFDGGVAPGWAVTADFDPLLAKLAVHGATREGAIARARQALRETAILGVVTNLSFLERVLAHPDFAGGELHTGFLAEHASDLAAPALGEDERRALVAAAALAHPGFRERVLGVPAPQRWIGAWRN